MDPGEAGTSMTEKWESRDTSRTPMRGGGGSPVYGLGMIGALVYFWKRAEGGKGKAAAVGKAVAWPAFLVHDLLRHLEG